MAAQQSTLSPREIQQIVATFVNGTEDSKPTQLIDLPSNADGQVVLDEIWKVLDSPVLPSATSGGMSFYRFRNKLRKLSLKLADKYNILPTALSLRGVERTDNKQYGAGAFSNVYCGTYGGFKVALKQLRIYVMSPESEKQSVKRAFYRESILWKTLMHDNIVPFLGVSEDIIEGTVCMVLPWLDGGSVRDHLDKRRRDEKLDGIDETMLNKWIYQTAQGLQYLHDEGIVHGDLHAANILIDDKGHACVTDFGLALIADASAYNYASAHGGGAIRWQAPELTDPEEFELQSSRPTPASDIFSFACTTIEIYTSKPPLPNLRHNQVSKFYVSGKRPPRPSPPEGLVMTDDLWVLIDLCWAHEISARPSAQEVVHRLLALLAGTSSTPRSPSPPPNSRSILFDSRPFPDSLESKPIPTISFPGTSLRSLESSNSNHTGDSVVNVPRGPATCDSIFPMPMHKALDFSHRDGTSSMISPLQEFGMGTGKWNPQERRSDLTTDELEKLLPADHAAHQLINDVADPAQKPEEKQYMSTFFCRALYDYQIQHASLLSFRKNDIIVVLSELESGWWDGLLGDKRGWFPSNCVVVISKQEAEAALRPANPLNHRGFRH